MPDLRNMSVKQKLISIIMLTCITALLLTGATFIVWEWTAIRQEMVRHLSTNAAIIADNCKAALAFEEAKDAEEALKALHVEPSVVFGCVYTESGKVFASYFRDGADSRVKATGLQESGYHFGDGLLSVFRPVVLDGETIGTVCLRSDLHPMYIMLRRNTSIVLAVLLFSSLVAFMVSSRLQKIISGPILSLAEVAKDVSQKKDYSVRATKQSNDEVGLLIDAFNQMLEQIQHRDLELVKAKEQLETRVEERTTDLTREIAEHKHAQKKLKETQQRLIEASHRAGMAEVATGVLHNVGNVLNSINVSTSSIRNKVLNSKTTNLKKVADLIAEHAHELGTFFTEDQRGKHIPQYLTEAARLIADEQADITEELQSLTKNVEHIKEIVKTQQAYAGTGGVEIFTSINDVIEDAIQINSGGLKRHGAKFKLDVADLPEIYIDKQRVLQILVNLVSNAKYALSMSQSQEKALTIRCYRHGKDRLRIEVTDNGVGIPQENLCEIFRHGFTTKEGGHGFGLHSSALAAKEIDGSLTCQSDGLGHGATFILELPFKPDEVTQQNKDVSYRNLMEEST